MGEVTAAPDARRPIVRGARTPRRHFSIFLFHVVSENQKVYDINYYCFADDEDRMSDGHLSPRSCPPTSTLPPHKIKKIIRHQSTIVTAILIDYQTLADFSAFFYP
jgi:hypothetical protein